jgi:hypothetical protein
LKVNGSDVHLDLHLAVWARAEGHTMLDERTLLAGDAADRRFAGAVRAGERTLVVERAPANWGLAARGALVEAGGPPLEGADLDRRQEIWSDTAPKLYAQAAASQWDPATAITWTSPGLPEDVESAVVQVMTYLVENEQAALMVPARHLGRMHPHYREVVQFLATQIADEARHIEVFSRRAAMSGLPLGISSVEGRTSLQTLLTEPDWTTASFLLSVLGEGTFLSLLTFLERFAPDPVTASVVRLASHDEARHVAFALGHIAEHVGADPALRGRLRAAVDRRHRALSQTAGLSPAVRDALVVIAAGSWDPEALRTGWDRVQSLQHDMDESRRRRLVRLGFSEIEAEEISALHTRNFM